MWIPDVPNIMLFSKRGEDILITFEPNGQLLIKCMAVMLLEVTIV